MANKHSFIEKIKGSAHALMSSTILCTVLVLATFNPTGYSFWHWISKRPDLTGGPEVLLVVIFGACHIAAWILSIRGMRVAFSVLTLAVLAAGTYCAFKVGWVTTASTHIQWLATIIVTTAYSIGVAFGTVLKIWTGQLAAGAEDAD